MNLFKWPLIIIIRLLVISSAEVNRLREWLVTPQKRGAGRGEQSSLAFKGTFQPKNGFFCQQSSF